MRREVRRGARAGRIGGAAFAGFLVLGLVGCTVVVAAGELSQRCEGEENDGKKACEDEEGVLQCVPESSVQYGCDPDSCSPCVLADAVARCSNSQRCVIATCEGDFLDCDEEAENGCEIDSRLDEANCGACGRACNRDHGVPACSQGICTMAFCDPGFEDCDSGNNGCETEVLENEEHCGACDTPCAGQCLDGECVL